MREPWCSAKAWFATRRRIMAAARRKEAHSGVAPAYRIKYSEDALWRSERPDQNDACLPFQRAAILPALSHAQSGECDQDL